MSTIDPATAPTGHPAEQAAADAPDAKPALSEREKRERRDKILRIAVPLGVVLVVLIGWHLIVVLNEIPHYILPRPALVIDALIDDWHILGPSLVNTLIITFAALFCATFGSLVLAIALTQSRIIEYSFSPIFVWLQVTPIVAVFPLINIYVDNIFAKLVLCAWIIAFFPILSNTTLGLNSADRNLSDLYRLYGASRWQTLRYLKLPTAMPYFLGGLKIAGGLALVGAVVAEYVAGTAGVGSGLASRLVEAGYRLDIPRLFAAIVLISLTGIIIHLVFTVLSAKILSRWHESAMSKSR